MVDELTNRQDEVLTVIEDYIADYGYSPSYREIAQRIGVRSTNAVDDHVRRLERKGFLSRSQGPSPRHRGLKRTEKKR